MEVDKPIPCVQADPVFWRVTRFIRLTRLSRRSILEVI